MVNETEPMVWWESAALMAIIRTQKITRPSIKINDLSALNKRPRPNGFLKLNEKSEKRRKSYLSYVRQYCQPRRESHLLSCLKKAQLVKSQLLLVGYILLYMKGFISVRFSVENICLAIWLILSDHPNQGWSSKSVKGDVMCDGISGAGEVKWFVALLPEVGKIDTRLSCGREPPQPGPLINKHCLGAPRLKKEREA